MRQNLGYIRFNILKIVRKLASLFNFLIFCMSSNLGVFQYLLEITLWQKLLYLQGNLDKNIGSDLGK